MHKLVAVVASAGSEEYRTMLRIQSKPIRTVLGWQLAVTIVSMLIAGFLAGAHGALSAALGGMVSLFAGLAFAVVASMSRAKTMEGALLGALRAEVVKLGLIVLLLWLVFALYRDIVALAFLGAFTVTVLIFAMAFFVRDV
jgi:ATP synthase protein I